MSKTDMYAKSTKSLYAKVNTNLVRKEVEKMTTKKEPEKMIQSKEHHNNLYIAVEGAVGDWACYVGKKNKGVEYVKSYGSKISEKEARQLFPEFKHLRWRP